MTWFAGAAICCLLFEGYGLMFLTLEKLNGASFVEQR